MTQTLKSNEFWGKRSGYFSSHVPKGHKLPFGNAIKQRQRGSGANNNKNQKTLRLVNINKKWFN